MKFAIPSVLAMATAPTVVQGWSLGPSYLFSPPLMLDTPSTAASVLKRQRDLANRMLEQTDRMVQQSSPFPSSPRFELVDDDETFRVALDVPGVKPEDVTISLEQDGYVTIRGERIATTENSRFASKFSQTFSLDPTVDVESFKANLDSGVLVISASKDKNKIEDKVRRIPITTGAAVTNTLKESTSEDKAAKVEIPVQDKHDGKEEEVMDLDKGAPDSL